MACPSTYAEGAPDRKRVSRGKPTITGLFGPASSAFGGANPINGADMQHLPKFERLLQCRLPANLSDAIDAAARLRCQSKSDYVRQSIIDRLSSDEPTMAFLEDEAA
jgi:hypothetical protein